MTNITVTINNVITKGRRCIIHWNVCENIDILETKNKFETATNGGTQRQSDMLIENDIIKEERMKKIFSFVTCYCDTQTSHVIKQCLESLLVNAFCFREFQTTTIDLF